MGQNKKPTWVLQSLPHLTTKPELENERVRTDKAFNTKMVESVKRLFERHQDIASKVRAKNPFLKTACMNVLLSLTQTMCQSPQEISKDDLAEQYAALSYLKDSGFELVWLEKKLDKVKEKKEKEEACLARLQEIKDQLHPLKRKYTDLEAQLDKVEDELFVARAPDVSLYDDNVV